ncbi:MAG: polysaccharide biosynthesis/export family protein [Marinobacter sp.]|uniref:XrtA/PEP-CTERM system exopolysaccharide export protein n=1 Tax=Marinobacter sp. TaxID=50741 RepID=UPI00299E1EDC|nr:XrtA/PEP-CTERM system exopolysaccharide export protein [Marinobacter sp.]MDX1754875.1 polysaccharide biosynthesis/export family protein [Marinobacter sp.]
MSWVVRFLRRTVVLISVIVMTGCVGPISSPPDKIAQALNMGAAEAPGEYVIGATDEISVSVWRNPDLSITVPVRPDGMISVPLVGDVRASGKTPERLADDIEAILDEYIREPQVSVVVTSMNSHEYTDRVRVTGAVEQPMSMAHRSGMTVLDMVLSAGGINPFAAPNNAMLYRVVDNEVVAIPVKLGDILNNGDIRTNYSLRAGDILTVPERGF